MHDLDACGLQWRVKEELHDLLAAAIGLKALTTAHGALPPLCTTCISAETAASVETAASKLATPCEDVVQQSLAP